MALLRKTSFAFVALVCLSIGLLGLAQEAVVEDDDYEDEERAFLLVKKSVVEDPVVQGNNFTVRINLYNAGLNAAWKIKLQEVALPAEISVVSGSTSHEIERINAGDSATWEYTLVANSAGHFVAPSCRVTYQAESDADSVQETLSTTFSMPILSPSQKNIKMALSMGSYASLGTLNSVTDWRNAGITLLTFGSLVGTRVAYSRISQAAKDRRRRRAIEELQGKSD
uniref:Translocon-associated protein beta n=1 Tax=Tetraselmis sp. GSL018 TaxID=582737 RepID=A0A061R6R6_9CHLO|mmetsp:Transcript_29173/g.69668  ORF Transcript_29173/g.69668 Transcript_29173/m.69668 type:complete len:226 (+) Transcript_29173:126-803(+)